MNAMNRKPTKSRRGTLPSMRAVDITARERMAFEMSLAGLTTTQIAVNLDVDPSVAWRCAEREARRRGLRLVRYYAVRVEPLADLLPAS